MRHTRPLHRGPGPGPRCQAQRASSAGGCRCLHRQRVSAPPPTPRKGRRRHGASPLGYARARTPGGAVPWQPVTPCVTFRRGVAPLRGPGQSPGLPFACCVGSLRSVGRCGRCSRWCRFRVRGAPSLVCRGCAECAMDVPFARQRRPIVGVLGVVLGVAGGRLTVFAAHTPPPSVPRWSPRKGGPKNFEA